MGKTSYATILSLAYNTLGIFPFLMPSMIPEVFPTMKTQDCPRRGPCTNTLEFDLAIIFMQVIVYLVDDIGIPTHTHTQRLSRCAARLRENAPRAPQGL